MVNKRIARIGIAGLVILVAVGLGVFNLLTTNNTAPSGALTAIPLVINTAAPATATSRPAATVASAIATGDATHVATTAVSDATRVATTAASDATTAAPVSGLTVYQIVPEQSQVSFTITEELNGQPNTVIGTTNLVAGQLALNAQDLAQTQVGVIQVDARGLTTDSDRRNGAIRNFILNTNQYEYITFTPKSVSGLTGAGQVGQAFTFQLTGDLTIRDITQSVTFDVSAKGETQDQISGAAKTTVNRSDYSLTIPSVPSVANVGEQVTLQIDFVANAAGTLSSTAAGSNAATVTGTTAPSGAAAAGTTTKLNLNTATADEILTVPNAGQRMVREFMEYRPYTTILQFRREIGKYVDAATVAGYEQYVYVPVDINQADTETLKQLPGVDDTIANALAAARPHASIDAFMTKLGGYVSAEQATAAKSYLAAG